MRVFDVKINNGPQHHIVVQTGEYRLAAAASLAILGHDDLPAVVEIWSSDLVQHGYGPYLFEISEDACGGLVARHIVRIVK